MNYLQFISIYAFFLFANGVTGEIAIFYPGYPKVEELEKEFNKNLGKVKVFDRANLFEKYERKTKGLTVVAPGVYFIYNQQYSVKNHAFRDSKKEEAYYLITLNKQLNSESVLDKKIGLWNEVGRKKGKEFVQDYFGWEPKMIKNVNNQEDLYTLLGLDMVDAIIVPERLLKSIQKKSNAELIIIRKSLKQIPIMSMATKNIDDVDVKKMTGINKNIWEHLAIDTWRMDP